MLYDRAQAHYAGCSRRLFHGSLPEQLLAEDKDPAFFSELAVVYGRLVPWAGLHREFGD